MANRKWETKFSVEVMSHSDINLVLRIVAHLFDIDAENDQDIKDALIVAHTIFNGIRVVECEGDMTLTLGETDQKEFSLVCSDPRDEESEPFAGMAWDGKELKVGALNEYTKSRTELYVKANLEDVQRVAESAMAELSSFIAQTGEA